MSRPGRPWNNAIHGAFNGPVKRERLSQHYFGDPREAQRVLKRWRDEYNNEPVPGQRILA